MKQPPPCAGKWELFDSNDPEDHFVAARMCDSCPMMRECRAELAAARLLAPACHPGPSGTWAGVLLGGAPGLPGHDRACLAREEAAYDADEARRAHAAFGRGDKSDWAVTGHRVWDRRRRRAKKAAGSAA